MLNNTLLKNVSLKIQVVPQLTRKVLFENILFLEVFAGTSSLIIEVRKTNLRGVAVDKGTERAKGPITILDLTMPEDLQFLMDFIRQEALNLCLVHFAPPCGTCSAARKRKLPSEVQAKLKDAGITPPQQLRSEQFPMGLPGIAGLDLYKVEQANKLYFATRDLALLAISLRYWVYEFQWKTPPIASFGKRILVKNFCKLIRDTAIFFTTV